MICCSRAGAGAEGWGRVPYMYMYMAQAAQINDLHHVVLNRHYLTLSRPRQAQLADLQLFVHFCTLSRSNQQASANQVDLHSAPLFPELQR